MSKYDWQEKKRLWSVPCRNPDTLILAKDLLFEGGDSQVRALDTSTGSELWKCTVLGRAQNLVAANQCLLVSTSQGKLYCFESSTP